MINVLYVDDEPALLSLGRTFLERSGSISVDTAVSVDQAVEMLERTPYDAIISDFQMPKMDGIQFLRYVRSERGQLPFILFTGRGREEVVIEALNNGADFYLQKGGEPKSQFAELEHNIRLAIERKRTRDELQESRQRMADLIEHLPDATFAVDLDGMVMVWNRTMEDLTGMPAEKILGTGNYSYALPFYGSRRPLLLNHFLGHIEDLKKAYPNHEQRGNRLISEGFFPKTYGGKGAFLWFVASPLFDTRGNIVGAIQSIRDITDRKTAEQNLVKTNEELHAAYEQLAATEEELRQNYDELITMERNLRESEQRYRNVIEDQTEFISRFTPDGTHIFVNEAYCRYFGKKRGEITGKKFTPAIPDADGDPLRSHFASLTRDRPVATVTHRIIMPDGEIRWQQWSDRAIFNPDGSVREYQSVGRDVTDLKTTEEALLRRNEELHAAYEQLTATEEELRQNYDELTAMERNLRESEQRYRNVIEDQTEFICRFTPDGTHIFVNEAYCRYFGKDRSDFINAKFRPDIPKEDRKSMSLALANLTEQNPIATITHRIIMPDGEVRWQQWTDRAIFNPDGTIREYQSVGRDVTDLKKTEEELLKKNEDLYAAYEQLSATEEELRQNYEELSSMERNLRESEQRYRNVIEDQTEFISRFTPDGTHIFVNEAYCRYFGIDRDEIIRKKFRPNIPKEDREKIRNFFGALTENNPVSTVTHRIIMPDGEIRWQQWSDRAIFNPDGTIREYQSVGRDVTDLKKTEEELLRKNEELNEMYEELTVTEEELRQNYDELITNQQVLEKTERRNTTLLGAIPDMMFIVSADGSYQDIHIPEDGDFYPYTRDLVGKHIRDTGFEKEVTQAILHRLDLAVRTKQLQQFEYAVKLSDRERIYEARLMALNEKEALAIVHDISRRVSTETTLRENERKLNAIVQGSPIPLFVIDKDHRVIQWNRMLEEFTGIKSHEVIGTSGHLTAFYPEKRPCLADLLLNESPQTIQELYSGKYRKSQFFEDAYEAVDFFPSLPGKDGEGRWLYFSAAPIRDPEGNIIGAVETLEDITEARQTEEARKQALKKLNLLSRITRHDILNQLTVLSGYLAISKMQSENPKILDYIRKEEVAAETIQRQIAFTRDYQNIGIHSPRWENLSHIINWVKSTLKPENAEIAITFENVEIYADPLLEKVFYNLIENALRHGETLTRITFSARETENGLTLLCEDDGTGIPASEKENIFNRKFFKNTGFGLFLSREILQITGLTIRETGEPGKGARFEIEVPKGAYRISR
ncbi:MAG: PAS domain S-box protein [Methanoregulaceae archaeon]